jgi:predicted dehydrogenase
VTVLRGLRRRRLTRRDFLRDSVLVAAAIAAGPVVRIVRAAEARRSANDRIAVAVLGLHGRGNDLAGDLLRQPDVDVVALCDPDPSTVAKTAKKIEEKTGKAPEYVRDLRKLYERKDLDAVAIATPNHWHTLAAIWAMQAGKDVYVEKPVSHNVTEGRRLAEAAAASGRIIQSGHQIRSHAGIRKAMEFLHAGKLGTVTTAYGLCYKPRGSIGRATGGTPVPPGCDYDLWLGPAPERPVPRKKFHYDWHWFWDYGNGDIGNQGVHQMDIARWGLGANGLPDSAVSVGGRLGLEDDGETPNTLLAVLGWGDRRIVFEVRGLKTDPWRGVSIGNLFECANGWVVVTSYADATAFSPKGEVVEKFSGGGDHMRNFLDAVRSREPGKQNGGIADAHLSAALAHLGNISYRLGEAGSFDHSSPPKGFPAATREAFDRMCEHVGRNNVSAGAAKLTAGRALSVDSAREAFRDDPEADRLLTRDYRRPFAVPSKL